MKNLDESIFSWNYCSVPTISQTTLEKDHEAPNVRALGIVQFRKNQMKSDEKGLDMWCNNFRELKKIIVIDLC